MPSFKQRIEVADACKKHSKTFENNKNDFLDQLTFLNSHNSDANLKFTKRLKKDLMFQAQLTHWKEIMTYTKLTYINYEIKTFGPEFLKKLPILNTYCQLASSST
jgi:hypothetical protein